MLCEKGFLRSPAGYVSVFQFQDSIQQQQNAAGSQSACEHCNTQTLFCKAPVDCSVICSNSPHAEVLPFLLQLLLIILIAANVFNAPFTSVCTKCINLPKNTPKGFSLLAPFLMYSQNLLLRSAIPRPFGCNQRRGIWTQTNYCCSLGHTMHRVTTLKEPQ